jgi:hypothetical protein
MLKNDNDYNNIMNITQYLPQLDPIYTENPIKLMLNNEFCGTMNFKNLNEINSVYQVMRHHQIISDNNTRLNNYNEYNKENTIVVKDIASGPKTPTFNYSRGDKIFNIIKDNNHPRRKIVKIIYEDSDCNNEDENYYIKSGEKVENHSNENEINNEYHAEILEGVCPDDNNAEYEGEDHFFNNCYKSFLG